MMERAGNWISGVFCWLIAAAVGFIGIYSAVLPGELLVQTGGEISGGFMGAELTEQYGGWGYSVVNMRIKQVELSQVERRMMGARGYSVWVKLRTEGVMVVSVNKGPQRIRLEYAPGHNIGRERNSRADEFRDRGGGADGALWQPSGFFARRQREVRHHRFRRARKVSFGSEPGSGTARQV